MATWRRNTQIVLSTWSASNIFTRNSWRSFPPDLWVMFIKVTVDRKSISPCWGTTPSIRLRSSYNLRVTQSYELPISKFRSLGNPPTSHRARKEIVDKGETVNSVSWGWRLVAATLSARPPQKHWTWWWWWRQGRWKCRRDGHRMMMMMMTRKMKMQKRQAMEMGLAPGQGEGGGWGFN